MSKLDVKIITLCVTNAIVHQAFSLTNNETEVLKLAVITLAENLETAQETLEIPAKITWEVTGSLVVCPKCARIREESKMTPEEHKKRHIVLHNSLDELAVDFISITEKKLSETSISELIEWSYKQSVKEDEREASK